MINKTTIKLNQTLHGYLNGHSLISTSMPLSLVDERRMLILSDMSGSSMTKGFETYVTGYHLIKEGIYVLAKTWYALEMERPGCVWTHSLLINSNDLKSISKPQALSRYFMRPENKREYGSYSEPIIVKSDLLDDLYYKKIAFSADECAEVVSLLYGYPDKQVFILADEASQYEDLIFKTWEYQGAKLRYDFSFCTGSITNRSTSDLEFDLQVIPRKNLNKIDKENKNQIFVHLNENKNIQYPSWIVNLVWNYIYENRSSDIKEHLNTWDADILASRDGYAKLLKIYFYYKSRELEEYVDFKRFVELIAQEFPSKSEATKLKAFFISDDKQKPYWQQQQADLFLQSLCSTKYYNAFDSVRPKLKETATNITEKRSMNGVVDLLTKILEDANPLGESFVEGFTEGLDKDKIAIISKRSESLLRVIIYNNPLVGVNSIVWDTFEDNQKERLDVLLSSPKINPFIAQKIIWYLLDSKKNLLSSKVFNRFGYFAVSTTLDWVNQHVSNLDFSLSKEWSDQLALHPSEVIQWLLSPEITIDFNVRTLAFITRLISPMSNIVAECDLKIWFNPSLLDLSLLSEEETIEYSVFLLSVSMSSRDEYCGKLIARTFLIVYNAARDNKLSYEIWQRISGKLPEIHWYQAWDKCERLRQGLLKKYMLQQITTNDFIDATNQEDVFDEIIRYALDHKHLRSFIKTEILKAPSENLNLSITQKNILIKYF